MKKFWRQLADGLQPWQQKQLQKSGRRPCPDGGAHPALSDLWGKALHWSCFHLFNEKRGEQLPWNKTHGIYWHKCQHGPAVMRFSPLRCCQCSFLNAGLRRSGRRSVARQCDRPRTNDLAKGFLIEEGPLGLHFLKRVDFFFINLFIFQLSFSLESQLENSV